MEFLKEIYGDQSLTYDQLAEKVGAKKMKLADLSGGAYVGKDKFETLQTDRDNLKKMLAEANAKLEGFDPEWKTKADQAQADADAKVAKIKRDYLYRDKVSGIKFSSESAKKAFLTDLESKSLPVQDDQVLGFDEFVKSYKDADPNAFAPEKAVPTVTIPGKGTAPQGTAQSTLDAKYQHNPFYKPKGE